MFNVATEIQSDVTTHGIDDLLCPICHEVMCEPVRMPCTHTFDRYVNLNSLLCQRLLTQLAASEKGDPRPNNFVYYI